MLVLTRHIGQNFYIGNNVRVTVLGCKRNEVRIGVQAPKDIEVDREEIRRRKLAERPTVDPIGS